MFTDRLTTKTTSNFLEVNFQLDYPIGV